jgi:hypothetical protein
MKQIIPVIFFLQGISPFLFYRFLAPEWRLYLVPAVIYSLITLGLWMAKRWAFILAIAITLLQVVTVCSPLFTWHLLIGPGGGLYCALPLSQSQYGVYGRLGVYFAFGIHKPIAWIQKLYWSQTDTFFLFNIFSALLTVLLLIRLRQIGRQRLNT